MNVDNLTNLLQQSFHLTLGATASLVETLQDPQKRTENLSQISSELSHLANEWAAKGEMTEQEARNFATNFLNQLRNQVPTASEESGTTSTEVAPPDVQLDLQELTAQIAAMRAELEELRNSDSNPS